MTLQEKFSVINCNDCDIPYCEIKCTILTPSELNHIEKIADEFAIEFSEWLKNLRSSEIDTIDYDLYLRHDTKQLLKIYKKEKGLCD